MGQGFSKRFEQMSEADSLPNGFRQIPDFPRYAIDKHGNVISICRVNRCGKDRLWANAKRIKPSLDKDGYPHVQLRHDGRKRLIGIHTLVLTAFVGPCPEGLLCRHLDGNAANNDVSNLAWGTPQQNSDDRVRHGRSGLGNDNGNAKLTASDVIEIRRRAANGESRMVIAKDFGVNVSNICLIILRKTWAHVASAETDKFFNDRHDARVAAGNQPLGGGDA